MKSTKEKKSNEATKEEQNKAAAEAKTEQNLRIETSSSWRRQRLNIKIEFLPAKNSKIQRVKAWNLSPIDPVVLLWADLKRGFVAVEFATEPKWILQPEFWRFSSPTLGSWLEQLLNSERRSFTFNFAFQKCSAMNFKKGASKIFSSSSND